MPNRDLVITLRGNEADLLRAFKAAQTGGEFYARELTKIERDQLRMGRAAERAAEQQAAAMTSVGTGLLGFGAAMVGGLGLATKAAIDWESAWAGVTKTVGGSEPEMAALEQELRNLAKELPATHQEIAAVAEAAGALGVKRENIISFTRTMIDLGETTDLTADAAATALARIGNVMGTSQSDVDRFGAALVELGSNGASTESEIVSMAQRIAGAGNQIGLSEGEVLGFASALSSVGIEAEAGGSSVSTFFIKMSMAVNEGGADLENFARVAGVSAEEFATRFRDDAAGATTLFVEGLGKIQTSGGDTFSVLDALGLSEIRLRDAMLRTAGAGDLLRTSIETGNQAWDDNSALVQEASKRYETTAARMEIARNQVTDFAITVGETFLPVVGAAADRASGWLEVMSGLPAPIQQAGAVLGGLAGTLSLVGGALLIGVPKLKEWNDNLAQVGPRAAGVSRGLAAAGGVLTGPWGLALGAGVLALGLFIDHKAQAAAEVREFTRAIESDSGALGDNTRALVVHKLEQDGMLNLARSLGISLATLTDAILGNEDAYTQVNTQLDGLIHHGKDFDQAAMSQAVTAESLTESMGHYRDTVASSSQAQQRQAEAMREAGQEHGDTAAAAGEHAAAQGELNIEMDDGTSQAEKLKAALDGLTGTHLAADEAAIRYLDTVHRSIEALGEHGAATDINTEAGRENRQALLDIAEAAQSELVAMVDAGAGVDEARTRHEFHRAELIRVAQQMGFTADEARRLADRYLDVRAIGSIETVFTARTAVAAEEVRRFADDVSKTVTTIKDGEVTVRFSSGTTASTLAHGGPITGPGTETSDDVPIWASHGEHMWTGREVRGAGGHAGVMRLRALAASGGLQGLAAGGPVLGEDVALNVHAAGLDEVRRDYAGFIKQHVGSGALGGASGPGGWQWQMAMLRSVFPGLQLISGFRPGSITATGNRSYHAAGRAVDVPPRGDVFGWIKSVYGATTKELIFSPAGAGQVWNGRPHLYGEPTRSDHWNHVHWAYDQGGIFGHGRFAFNRSGHPERVLSPQQTEAFERLVAALTRQITLPPPETVRPAVQAGAQAAVRSAATRAATTITVGPVYVRDPVDVDMLADRLAFRAAAASFG